MTLDSDVDNKVYADILGGSLERGHHTTASEVIENVFFCLSNATYSAP